MAFKNMGYKRSKADPGLHFKWVGNKLRMWLTWIDDCLALAKKMGLSVTRREMTS